MVVSTSAVMPRKFSAIVSSRPTVPPMALEIVSKVDDTPPNTDEIRLPIDSIADANPKNSDHDASTSPM